MRCPTPSRCDGHTVPKDLDPAPVILNRLQTARISQLYLFAADDLIGVAQFVNAYLHKMNPPEGRASDQPGVAGRDVM